jgi:hypothetical protein
VAVQPETGAVQSSPGELPQPAKSGAPIVPPLSAPQPAWKQELKSDSGDKGTE